MFAVSLNIIPKPNGYIGYKQIDFSGIQQIKISAIAFPAMGYVGGAIEIRLDKPDGDLLGRTEIAAVNPSFMVADSAQNAGGAKAKPAKAGATAKKPAKAPRKIPDDFNPFAGMGIKLDIKAIIGLHDVYFVFKNEKANPDALLMSVSNIQFNNHKEP
jgi:cytochrome c